MKAFEIVVHEGRVIAICTDVSFESLEKAGMIPAGCTFPCEMFGNHTVFYVVTEAESRQAQKDVNPILIETVLNNRKIDSSEFINWDEDDDEEEKETDPKS